MNPRTVRSFLARTSVLRQPKHVLATFGSTEIEYHLLSPVDRLADKTRLRSGKVLSERPQILTADALRERFQGFGPEAAPFLDFLSLNYGDALGALQYVFKNQDMQSSVLSEKPEALASRLAQSWDGEGNEKKALVLCPDGAWTLALMKLTLDEAVRSFPTHMRDLGRRGLFDPARHAEDRRRREIEALFADAGADRGVLKLLGEKLREYGLFDEYEGRYLSYF